MGTHRKFCQSVNHKNAKNFQINPLTEWGRIRQVVQADDDATTYSG
ncbi:hypothetical protein Z946_3682 [Sulfitobacter noctilucicola]|nr:hypothetical protein Z946_3682 [Sulfitobacter noctilucicola]